MITPHRGGTIVQSLFLLAGATKVGSRRVSKDVFKDVGVGPRHNIGKKAPVKKPLGHFEQFAGGHPSPGAATIQEFPPSEHNDI